MCQILDPGTQRWFVERIHNILRKTHTKEVLWNYSNTKRKTVFYPQVVGEGSMKEIKAIAVTKYM